MHTWRGYVKYTLGSGCQLWGSRLASSTHVATEAWAGHQYSSWGLVWVKKEFIWKAYVGVTIYVGLNKTFCSGKSMHLRSKFGGVPGYLQHHSHLTLHLQPITSARMDVIEMRLVRCIPYLDTVQDSRIDGQVEIQNFSIKRIETQIQPFNNLHLFSFMVLVLNIVIVATILARHV
ncbi:hypothetical protein EI555_018934, partial [Monodon monoceros]